jgi:hypothetical protein
MMRGDIIKSNDLRKLFAHCPIWGETDKRKAAASNTAQE